MPPPIIHQAIPVEAQKLVCGSKGKTKESSKEKDKAANASKTGKRGSESTSRNSTKRSKVSHGKIGEAATNEVGESDVKSEAKSEAKSMQSFGFGTIVAPQTKLVQRCDPQSTVIVIHNMSISEFLVDAKKSDFKFTITQVWLIYSFMHFI